MSRWFLQAVSKRAEEVQDGLATGKALRQSAEETAMAYARQFGISEGLCAALTLEPPIAEASR